ncbi:MAG: flagellar biosynthesis protein FlhB [Bryobacteraceae bacterium]
MADQGQRTEEPTQQRLRKAREEGRFPVSKEFVSSLQFAAFVWLLGWAAPDWLEAMRETSAVVLAWAFEDTLTPGTLLHLFRAVLFPTVIPLAWLGAILMAVALVVQLATTQFGFAVGKLAPDLKRLNPMQKLRELPRQNLPALFRAVVLLPVFAWVIYRLVGDSLHVYLSLPLFGIEAALARTADSLRSLLWKAAAVFLVLGAFDLFRQRRRYTKDLRMTKQEVRDEHKQSEGDPQIKMRVRRLRRDLLRRRMMSEVPKATAVIVNPTHYAVAIQYRLESMAAPTVIAKGKNYLALRIRAKAVECGIPIVENPPLAQALYKSVDVGQEIPAHLYRAVAEILAYIFRLMKHRMTA